MIHFVQPMGQQSDSNGNTTSMPDSTGAVQYAWDFENRLIDVTLPGNGGTVSFAYDPFGRRIKKVTAQYDKHLRLRRGQPRRRN